MDTLDYKKYLKLEELIKKNNEIRELTVCYLNEFAELNIPLSVCLEMYNKLEGKINDLFSGTYITKWKEISINQCNDLSKKLIEEYKKNPELNEVFGCLDTIEDIFKFIDDSEINEKKYEIIFPQIMQFFVNLIKKSVKDNKTKNEEEISNLKHEKSVLEGLVEQTKKMLKETNEKYEKQISDLKEENLENRLDLEAKIDEKSKAIQNLKNSNENTIEELKYKIEELNIVIDSYKQKEKEDNNSKKKKKKNNSIDDEVVQYKLDGIISRIDNLQNVLFKTEIEKVRNQMLTEMDAKYEEVQDQFKNKLKTTKRNCENFLKRLKESKDTEIEKLKQIIKDLNDEIQDYKSQVDSQEYKIALFKEKIINYEKEKKQQTDHAELLRVLALKLNSYIEMLSKAKK